MRMKRTYSFMPNDDDTVISFSESTEPDSLELMISDANGMVREMLIPKVLITYVYELTRSRGNKFEFVPATDEDEDKTNG